MSTAPKPLSRKRLATRQEISNTATLLFWEKGFDQVTVDEIAAAAGVARMTVFNHFPRKEDMFFDRDDEGRETLRQALRQRDVRTKPIEALRLLAHSLVAQNSPYINFSDASRQFINTIGRSETLKARARAIRDEIAQVIAQGLAECVKRDVSDPAAQLAAGLLLATWTVALQQAHHYFHCNNDATQAKALFLALVDKGCVGISAALAGTDYA